MNRRLFNLLMTGAVAGLSLSCSQENIVPDAPDTPAEGYHFTFDGGVDSEADTRAHWTDEKGSGNLTFNWDYTTQEDMEAGKYEMVMRFKNEEGTLASNGGNNYTYASIHEHSEHPGDAHWAKFKTVETYPNDMLSGEYEGYNVLAVTPCKGDWVTVSEPTEEFKVTLEMPGQFRQNADQNPDFLRDYMYMYATGTIANGGASLAFRHIPATLRFIITNKRPKKVQLKSVVVEPIKAVMASMKVTVDNEGNLTFGKYYEQYLSVETLMSNTYVEENAEYTAYALVLPLADNDAFKGDQLKFTIEAGSPDNRYLSYVLDADKLASANPNGEYNWVGGKSYTICMSLGDVLTVDGITASSWEPVDNGQLKTE